MNEITDSCNVHFQFLPAQLYIFKMSTSVSRLSTDKKPVAPRMKECYVASVSAIRFSFVKTFWSEINGRDIDGRSIAAASWPLVFHIPNITERHRSRGRGGSGLLGRGVGPETDISNGWPPKPAAGCATASGSREMEHGNNAVNVAVFAKEAAPASKQSAPTSSID